MFFYFAKSVTFYLYICISLKRLFLIVVVSNNKLFNRVSHNVVTWDVYLHLFIIPLLTHIFSHPRGFLAWKLQVIYYVKFDICYGFHILSFQSVFYSPECFLGYPMFYMIATVLNIAS